MFSNNWRQDKIKDYARRYVGVWILSVSYHSTHSQKNQGELACFVLLQNAVFLLKTDQKHPSTNTLNPFPCSQACQDGGTRNRKFPRTERNIPLLYFHEKILGASRCCE